MSTVTPRHHRPPQGTPAGGAVAVLVLGILLVTALTLLSIAVLLQP